MARSKPRRTIELTYAEITQLNDNGTLYPCLIGPRYTLHTMDNGKAISEQFTGKEINIAYEQVDYTSVVDYNNASVKLAECWVEATSGSLEVSSIDNNVITFVNAVAGEHVDSNLKNNYAVREGDKIRLTSPDGKNVKDVTIVDVESGNANKVIVETLNILDNSKVSSIICNTTDVAYGNRISYALQVDTVNVDTENGVKNAKISISSLVGDLDNTRISGVAITPETELSIGTKGVKITFNDTFFTQDMVGAVIAINIDAAPELKMDRVSVNADVSACSGYQVSVLSNNIVTYPIVLSDNYYNAAADGVTIDSDVHVIHANLSYKVVEAVVFVEYRELRVDGANEIRVANSEGFAEFIGDVSPDNPLSMMAYCANLAGTDSYYVISVEDNDYASYVKAINVAVKYENVFSSITYSTDNDVIAYLKQQQAHYNSPEVAQFKKLWITDNTEKEQVVYQYIKNESDGVISTTPLLATVVGEEITFYNGDLIANGVKKGDTVVFANAYDSVKKTYGKRSYKIVSVDSSSKLKVKSTYVSNISSPEIAYVVRTLSNRDYATVVANKAASHDSPYINYVWADHANCIGYGEIGLNYLAVTLAALRCVNAPHAPLSDVVVPGWTVGNNYVMTEDDLDIMNNKGVWIVYTDTYGFTVTRHQLTTSQDGTLAEEDSAVSNACNIIRSLRSMLYNYRGDSNVQEDMLGVFYTDLTNALVAIMKRSYPAKIGAQLSGYNINQLQQDPDNAARIVLDCDMDVPEPFLEGNYKFNII